MRLCWRYLLGTVAGGVYCFILLFGIAILSGGGEGFTISWAVFGSPLAPLVLVNWPLLGALIAGGHATAARVVLAVHVLAMPFAIQQALRSEGLTLSTWPHAPYFEFNTPWAAIIFSFHAISLVAFWWLAPRCARVLKEL